jgi:hypothetical protein
MSTCSNTNKLLGTPLLQAQRSDEFKLLLHGIVSQPLTWLLRNSLTKITLQRQEVLITSMTKSMGNYWHC